MHLQNIKIKEMSYGERPEQDMKWFVPETDTNTRPSGKALKLRNDRRGGQTAPIERLSMRQS